MVAELSTCFEIRRIHKGREDTYLPEHNNEPIGDWFVVFFCWIRFSN